MQASTGAGMCLKVPLGFHAKDAGGDDISNSYCLKFLKNYCGSRDAAANWHAVLLGSLEERRFKKSTIDPCLFTREDCAIITHADDCLIFCKKKEVLMDLIESLKDNFKLADKGDLESLLGIQFKKINKSILELAQSHLIEIIIDALRLRGEFKKHNAPSNAILLKDADSKLRRQSWNWRSTIGMLNCTASVTAPNMLFSAHQAAKHHSNPKRSYEEVVKKIGRCLKRMPNKGIICKFDATVLIEACVDADSSGNWNLAESHLLESSLLRTTCVTKMANCPAH